MFICIGRERLYKDVLHEGGSQMNRVLYTATVPEHSRNPCLPLPPLRLVRPFSGVTTGLLGKKKAPTEKENQRKLSFVGGPPR